MACGKASDEDIRSLLALSNANDAADNHSDHAIEESIPFHGEGKGGASLPHCEAMDCADGAFWE